MVSPFVIENCNIHHNTKNSGFFRDIDWNLNSDPMEKISWNRVQNAVESKLPISGIETLFVNGTKLSYLSPIEISRRWYGSGKGNLLTQWRGKKPGGELEDVYDGSSWNEFIENGFLNQKRNLVYMIGADGFSKFRSRGNSLGIYF